MSCKCRCGMPNCPNSEKNPSYVQKFNPPSKVICQKYSPSQHDSLVNNAVYLSNVYPTFVERPNFQFYDNGFSGVRGGESNSNYNTRELHARMGGSNNHKFNHKRKKVKFWGDSPNLMDPPPKKIAYYKLNSRPSDMTVVSFN